MQNSAFLTNINIHKSWVNFLSNKTISLLIDIERTICIEKATPRVDLVLRFLEMDLSSIPVIILGQDPYPQVGIATGRAFEVNGLNSWHDKFRNVSLKNILRSIYKASTGEKLKYSEILRKLNEGDCLGMNRDFKILPPNKLFRYWSEKQHVLLLNTAFTCEIGNPNSHTKVWAPFTQALLRFIAQHNPDMIWFLWGNNAQNIVKDMTIVHKIETAHPMMCYQRDNDILFGKVNPFVETLHLVDWTGRKE